MRDKLLFGSRYSKTPIYRASRGKGKRPGKSGDTVNRGTEKIVQNLAYQRLKTINYALELHNLVHAFCGFTYSTQNLLGKYFSLNSYCGLNHCDDHTLFCCLSLPVRSSSQVL